jgi:hypothetical protein
VSFSTKKKKQSFCKPFVIALFFLKKKNKNKAGSHLSNANFFAMLLKTKKNENYFSVPKFLLR